MKGGIGAHVLANKIYSTRPPKHMTQKGNGKPGQTFSVERLEKLCERYGLDPCEVAVKGLSAQHAPDLKDKDRADIALKLMEYLMPKKRSIEGEVEVEHHYVISSDPLDDSDWEAAYSMGATEGASKGPN